MAVETTGVIDQRLLQLNEARKLRHQLAGGMVLERRAERHQRIAEGVVARQHLHRRPGAGIRRAQHQQAGAGPRHHLRPDVGAFELHRARDQAAHRMRNDAHRLAALVACRQRGLHIGGKPLRFLLDRLAPVVGKLDDFMGLTQDIHQRVVAQADRATGLYLVARGVRVFEALQPIDQPPAQPDALAIDLQVAAQDARQNEHRGLG